MSTLYRRELPFIVIAPQRLLIQMHIAYNMKFHEQVGRVILKYRIKPIHVSSKHSGDLVEWDAILDVSEAGPMEVVVKEFKEIPGVAAITLSEPKQGFLVDAMHFPLTTRGGVPEMTFSIEMLAKMLMNFKKLYGSGAFSMLYEMGKYYGTEIGKHFKSIALSARASISNRELIDDFFNFMKSAGWFIPEVELSEGEKPTAVLKLRECFEDKHGERTSEPYCPFMRGFLTGFFNSVYEKEFTTQETKCISKGDPYCEFQITTQP